MGIEFFAGMLTGFGVAVGSALYLLSIPKFGPDKEPQLEVSSPLNESSAEDEGAKLTSAIQALEARHAAPVPPAETISSIVEFFSQCCREAKQRLKDANSTQLFFTDLAKCQTGFSKDLQKLSAAALKQHRDARDYEEHDCGLERDDGIALSSCRWQSLAVFLNALSQDCDSLGILLASELAKSTANTVEEFGLVEKELKVEGFKVIDKYKFCQSQLDVRARDRDLSLKKKDASTDYNIDRRIARVEVSEDALNEARGALEQAEQEIRNFLPKVSAELRAASDRVTEGLHQANIKLAEKFVFLLNAGADGASRHEAQLCRRMTEEHEAHLLCQLQAPPGTSIDLSLEATANLAASRLPRNLPRSFAASVQSETAVWFNAIIGRVYRDASSSKDFHEWACTRTSHTLNKGKRPPLLAPFVVTRVEFGVSPPILTNVRWLPGNGDDVQIQADLCFRSGIQVSVETEVALLGVSVKVRLRVQLCEMRGHAIFCCTRTMSQLSFDEMPHVLITASSEVGSRFSLKDVPSVTDFVVGKIRKAIRNRLVAPNSHSFRLIWPRSWWPADAQTLFPSLATAPVVRAPISGDISAPSSPGPALGGSEGPSTPCKSADDESVDCSIPSNSPQGGKNVAPPAPSPASAAAAAVPPLSSRLAGWARQSQASLNARAEKLKTQLSKARAGLRAAPETPESDVAGADREQDGEGEELVGEE